MKAHFSIQASFMIALVLLTFSTMSGQGHASIVWFKIHDDLGGHDSLNFGNHPSATYCTDVALGEYQSTPYPPGFSVVFMSIPGHVNCFSSLGMMKKDLRPILHAAEADTFDIQFQNNDSAAQRPGTSVTLRWPDANYLRTQGCDSMFLVDRVGGVLIPSRIDMLAQTSIVLTGQYDYFGSNPTAPVVKLRVIKYTTFLVGATHDQNQHLPKSFALQQNYPNPFNPSTRIDYALPSESQIRLEIFNLLGQSVAVLKDGIDRAGYNSVMWDASPMTSGIYFYRLEVISTAGTGKRFVQVRKLVLLR